jgi:uncharacterized protein (TIGR00251 family)
VKRLIECKETDGWISFKVRVVPRASRSRIVGEHDGALRVRVASPPVEGAANEELVRMLAKEFRVPARAVEITSGHTSKLKHVRVTGVTVRALENLLGRNQ